MVGSEQSKWKSELDGQTLGVTVELDEECTLWFYRVHPEVLGVRIETRQHLY